jgi:mono/diheme cytochrome c family protein
VSLKEKKKMSEPASRKNLKPFQEYLILALLIMVAVPVALWMGLRDGRDLVKQADWKREVVASAPQAGNAQSATPASTHEGIERGAALFQTNCVACHGPNADGKGAAAVAFTPPPRDFTDPAAHWTNGRLPAQIFGTLTGGVQGTGMAGFAGSLTEAQRWDLVHYIRSLPGVLQAKD